MEELQQQIHDMLHERAIGLYEYRQDELEQVQQEIEKFQRLIEDLLPEEKQEGGNRKIVNDMDDLYSDREVIVQDQAYRRGLYDGIKLAKGFQVMGLELALVLKELEDEPFRESQ